MHPNFYCSPVNVFVLWLSGYVASVTELSRERKIPIELCEQIQVEKMALCCWIFKVLFWRVIGNTKKHKSFIVFKS